MPNILKKRDDTTQGQSILEDKWGIAICLGAIFVLAFFIRTYFAFELSTKFGTPFLLTGGSDAYYYERIVEYIAFNNRHLLHDNLLNYPIGRVNPRPPLYGWSVALTGHILAPLVGDLTRSLHYTLILSTGFWGALTIFPVYLVGRDIFGKKAGVAAAFLLAISAGHLQRSPIGNADHDAIYLFFAITGFYFLMKALKYIPEKRKWVKDWTQRADIKEGLSTFVHENKKALLYSAMAGMCVGSVALSWQGYAYVFVIILAYYYIQLFLDKFRYRDSLGVTACVGVTLVLGLAIAAPFYLVSGVGTMLPHAVGTWFDVPLILTTVALIGGVALTVTRDYPWVLVLSALFAIVAGVVVFAYYFAPGFINALTSGAGYFTRTKTIETIAEAQAPEFSNLVFSFGPVSFFLSIVAVGLGVWHIREKWTTNFLFILTWTAFAIYMATSAARFIFNGAPAFALMAGWLVALAADKAQFHTIYRRLKGFRGGFFIGLKRGIKVGHVLTALFIVFLIVMPNVLYGFDAGIPFEEKNHYDQQINQALPELLRPEDYDDAQAHNWHLGAFGFGIDKPTDYWPAAWEWLKEENSHLPPEKRPGVLSWWDYGFESAQRAHNPTVADNFLSGHRLAGNVLMAQNESELMSLLIVRVLELPVKEDGGISGDVREILVRNIGEEKTDLVEDAFLNPEDYRDEVLSDPDRYHHRADDIHPGNVRYARLMGLLSYEDLDVLVDVYHELTEELDKLIKYIAVDTRLFPFDARQTGIFYAPAKLSGHRIVDRTPIDFYNIVYVDMQGNEYEDPDEIPPGVQIVDFKMNFKPAFYNTVLYRTFAGLSGEDAGEGQGIPGVDIEEVQPMPAWGMENFRLATRTAYWNPYPREEVGDHPEAWKAVSLQDAIRYQQEENGTVDMSARSYMRQGVVFIEYFHGALVSGRVDTSNGHPVPDARVTILDEMGTPHQVTYTDEDGMYEIKAPAGELSLVVSTGGDEEAVTKTESIYLGMEQFEVTDEQAMRKRTDRNGDGRWDYLIRKDFEVDTSELTAQVFIDKDDSGEYIPGNDTLVESTIKLDGIGGEMEVETDGSYTFTDLIPGKYTISSDTPGTSPVDVTLESGEHVTEGLKIQVASLSGEAIMDDPGIEGVELYLDNIETGERYVELVEPGGNYTFQHILSGDYMIGVEQDEYTVSTGPKVLGLEPDAQEEFTVNISRAHVVEGVAESDVGTKLSNQRLSFTGTLGREYSHNVVTDAQGEFTVKLPTGDYTVYGIYRKDNEKLVHLGTVSVPEDTDYVAEFGEGHQVEALVVLNLIPIDKLQVEILNSDGTIFETQSNREGYISASLPRDSYTVYGWKSTPQADLYYRDSFTLDSDKTLRFDAVYGHSVEGRIYRDLNFDEEYDEGEGISAKIEIMTNGHSISLLSSRYGRFTAVLPNEEVVARFTKEGFYEKEVYYDPEDEFGPYFAVEAKNVNVYGSLEIDSEALHEVSIRFEAVGEGAVDAETVVENGEYEIELQPGEYNAIVDHSPEEGISYHLDERINIEPMEESLELPFTVNHTVRLYGTVLDEDGNELSAILSLRGPWDKELIVENGTYELYLPVGTYSMWCADRDGELVVTDKLTLDSPTEYNITLEPAVTFSPLVTYEGEPRENIQMTFENLLSGYSVTRVTDEDGTFSVNLASGEYEVEVDYQTTEPVDGILRKVRYLYSDLYDLTVSTSPHISLEREMIYPTLSGNLRLNDQTVPDTTITFLGQTPEAVSTSVETTSDGSFSLPISQGMYSIYVKYEGRVGMYAVFKSFAMGETDEVLNITLDSAFKLTGTVSRNGVATSSEISIVELEKAMELEDSSEEDGSYTLILPEGRYRLSAETTYTDEELGDIRYKDEQEIDLRYNIVKNLELSKVKEYGIEIGTIPVKDTEPDDVLDYYITLTNTGNTDDVFQLSKAPDAIWDMEFEPSTIELEPKESRTVKVTLYVPEDAIVNPPPMNFMVESLNSEESESKELNFNVAQHYGVRLLPDVSRRTLRDGQIIYTLLVENTGNGKDTFDLLIQNQAQLETQGWDVSIDSQTGEVTEDSTAEVELVLTPDSQQPSSDIAVQIKATSMSDPSTEDTAYYDIELPHLYLDEDSFAIEGEGILIEEDTFEMGTGHWVLLVILAVVAALYYTRKKGWWYR